MSAPATLSRQTPPAAVEHRRRLSPPWWPDAAIMGLLGLAAILVLIVFRREPVFSDDLVYWRRWATLDEPSGMANDYRLALVVSAHLSRLVFGNTLAGYSAVGVLYGAGLVIAIYALTRLLFPRVVAAGSAVVFLVTPVFLEEASLLLPDWPSMFWFVAGLALLVYAATRLEPGRRQLLVAGAAGLCVFLSMSVKDGSFPILIVVPACMILVAGLRRGLRLTMAAAAASLLFLVVELGILAAIYGEPLRRIRVILGGHIGGRVSESLGGQVQQGGASPLAPDAADPLTWGDLADRYVDPISSTSMGRWLLTLAGLAVVVTLVARSRRIWVLAVPAFFGTGFVLFAVGSVDPIVPLLSMKYRYLSLGWVFLVPLMVVAVWTVTREIARRVATRVAVSSRAVSAAATSIVVVGVGLLTFSGISDAVDRPVFVRSGEDGLRQIEALVDELRADDRPFERIVTDGRTLNGIEIKFGPDDQHLVEDAGLILHPETSELLPTGSGDLVIVNRKRLGLSRLPNKSDINEPLPEDLLIPPPHWQLLGGTDIQNFRFYYVEEPSGSSGAGVEPLTTSGRVVTDLMRGSLTGRDRGRLTEEYSPQGAALALQQVDRLRIVLGEGSHLRAPRDAAAQQLGITDPARLGVRVDVHADPGVTLSGFWLRTYGANGRLVQNSRMYQALDEDRVAPAAFPSLGEPFSFVDHVDVDPDEDITFRVVGFAEGTGLVTIDRVAFRFVPLD